MRGNYFQTGGGGGRRNRDQARSRDFAQEGAHQPRVGQNRVTITYAHLEVAGILTVLDSKQDKMKTVIVLL